MKIEGSLVNSIYGSAQSATEPEEGVGATECMWSDRHAGTIVAVRHFTSGKRKGQVKEVDWQRDSAARIDNNGMSDCQTYAYSRAPEAPVKTFRVDSRGIFRPCYISSETGTLKRSNSGSLAIGIRDEHYDYSF